MTSPSYSINDYITRRQFQCLYPTTPSRFIESYCHQIACAYTPPPSPFMKGTSYFTIEFSPKGSHFATAIGNQVMVMHSDTLQVISSFEAHNEIVTDIAFLHQPSSYSPSTLRFFTCSLDKTISLWCGLKRISNWREHNDWIRCMDVSIDDQHLISGCVSNMIYGWDIVNEKVIFKIENDNKSNYGQHGVESNLNAVNSLQFQKSDSHVFASASKDGKLNIWDTRALDQSLPVVSIKAHEFKMNMAQFDLSEQYIMSSGRDHAIRLWDRRKMVNGESFDGIRNKACVHEYTQHRCSNYNIPSHFMDHDRYIVTGSEDQCIYIYNTHTQQVVHQLTGHKNVVHMVKVCPSEHNPYLLLSSAMNYPVIYQWTPMSLGSDINTMDNKQHDIVEMEMDDGNGHSITEHAFRLQMEAFLIHHGDYFLRKYHSLNMRLSDGINIRQFIETLTDDDTDQAVLRDLLQLLAHFSANS